MTSWAYGRLPDRVLLMVGIAHWCADDEEVDLRLLIEVAGAAGCINPDRVAREAFEELVSTGTLKMSLGNNRLMVSH